MSTLEKAITLLRGMPEQSIEAVYRFMRFVQSEQSAEENRSAVSPSMDGLHILQSFSGTLPEDFDYKRELEEARNEKYGRFN